MNTTFYLVANHKLRKIHLDVEVQQETRFYASRIHEFKNNFDRDSFVKIFSSITMLTAKLFAYASCPVGNSLINWLLYNIGHDNRNQWLFSSGKYCYYEIIDFLSFWEHIV